MKMISGEINLRGLMINFKPPIKLPSLALSMQTKVTVISVTVGITLLGFLARILRRRKRGKPKPPAKTNPFAGRRSKQSSTWSLTNGEIMPLRPSVSPSTYRHTRQGSIGSDRQSIHSLMLPTVSLDTGAPPSALTPQQLGTMGNQLIHKKHDSAFVSGMEALETAIGYWEDALTAYRPPPGDMLALTDAEEGKFTHMLEKILDEAYKLQECCSQLFLNESSVLFKEDSMSVASSRQERLSVSDRRTITTLSSIDSFVSAQAEVADLQDFDEFAELNIDLKEFALYQMALKKYEEGSIPIRLLRTEMVKCQTNMEYISKVHCVRVAFKELFADDNVHKWFFDVGYKILAGLMLCGEKDPKDCLIAYENIVDFSKDKSNWEMMEEELQGRGVKDLTFYDVVIDFIVLDAFEDLDNPPSSVLAVVQNRWLSTGFKETALTTAIWSVLKAKRRMLKFPDGFISQFYCVSEHLIPVLAWGFLGPNEKLKEICTFFKGEVLGFVLDIFNFNKVRYTKVEDLASDIMELAKQRFDRICDHLSF